MDNSAGGQVWVPADAKGWGDLAGKPLHLSYGRCKAYVLLRQELPNGMVQGGVAETGLKFLSGVTRGRFAPDGTLYVVGLNGWQTAAQQDGCLQRVVPTGKPFDTVVKHEVTKTGVRLTFSRDLDKASAENGDELQIGPMELPLGRRVRLEAMEPQQPEPRRPGRRGRHRSETDRRQDRGLNLRRRGLPGDAMAGRLQRAGRGGIGRDGVGVLDGSRHEVIVNKGHHMNEDDEKWATASFRVFSKSLSPDELRSILGICPTDSYGVGDPVSRRSPSNTRKVNALFVNSTLPSDKFLDEHLGAVVSVAESCREQLQSHGDQIEADLFCCFSATNGQGGFVLSPALLARIAALQLEVIVDLYPPSIPTDKSMAAFAGKDRPNE